MVVVVTTVVVAVVRGWGEEDEDEEKGEEEEMVDARVEVIEVPLELMVVEESSDVSLVDAISTSHFFLSS